MFLPSYEANPAFINYDPCDPCGEKRPAREAARAKRKALHRMHPNMMKLHIKGRDFDDLLRWQQDLWERFIDTFVGVRTHDFQGKWSDTIKYLLEQARCWERPAEVSTAHVKWLAMFFAKKAHRLQRLPTASECPSFMKVCEKVQIDESWELKLPCIERFICYPHLQSKKDWNFIAGRHITSAAIYQERFKRKRYGKVVKTGVRWVVTLTLVPEAQRQEIVEPRRVGRPRKHPEMPAQQVSVFDSHSRLDGTDPNSKLEGESKTDTCCAGVSSTWEESEASTWEESEASTWEESEEGVLASGGSAMSPTGTAKSLDRLEHPPRSLIDNHLHDDPRAIPLQPVPW